MSLVLQSSSKMEEFFGVLYELVRPMLASENCVKCITQEGNVTFTTDIEHLLSSLDIEHVAGELVVKALQSHKSTFGTGTKTLLFMMTSLAKAVTQLQKLGIPIEKSLHVIHKTFADLSKDVEEISIKTQESLHLSDEENSQPKIVATEENCNKTAKPKSIISFSNDHRNAEAVDPSSEQDILLFEFGESRQQEVIHSLMDNRLPEHGSEPYSAHSVHLAMSNLQDLSSKADDVEWFFNCNTSHQVSSAVTNDIFTEDFGCQGTPGFSSNYQDDLLCSEYKGCTKYSFNSATNGNNLTARNINSTGNMLRSSYTSQSILGSMNCINQKKLFSDIEIFSFKGHNQHDRDFEDCFDDTDKKQVNEDKSFPYVNVCKNDSDLFKKNMSSSVSGFKCDEPVVFDKQRLEDIAFNTDDIPQLFDSEKYQKSSDDDEFNASNNDIDLFDCSGGHENSLIEHPTTHHVCETLDKSKQSSRFFPVEVSNKCWDTSWIESMAEANLTCDAVDRNKNVEQFRVSDEKSSEHIVPDSEVEIKITRLNFLDTDNAHVNVSTSSKHLQYTQNRTPQPVIIQTKVLVNEHKINNPTRTIEFCENSSSKMPEDIHYNLSEYTTEISDNDCYATTLTSDNLGNGQCDTHSYIMESIENGMREDFSKEFCNKNYQNGTINPSKSDIAETVNEVTDLSFKEQSTIQKNSEHKTQNKEMLLECLLLQKKSHFRSSLAERVMTSSRHLCNSYKNTLDWASSSQKDCELIPHTVNMVTANSCNLIPEFNNGNLVSDLECSNNKHLHTLVQDIPSSIPSLSCPKFENLGKIYHPFSKLNYLSHKLNVSYLGDLTCCTSVEASSNLSGNTKQTCFSMRNQEVTADLHDCCGNIAVAVMQLLQNQKRKAEKIRFNPDLVECLSIPSSASSVSVVSGLAIPCDTFVLEKLQTIKQPLLTLLINADLSPHFHHKGYKPPLKRRTFIAKPFDESQESNEISWCVKALNIINQLNVKLVLVRGKASSFLLDMCEGAGVLMVTNISYHTLSILSHLQKVDMVTYITLASEENVCTLCLEPSSTEWKDHLLKSEQSTMRYFAFVTNTSDVQTAVFHCSSTMSAQIVEERFWKCLHSVANSQADAKVLPGGGNTEIWCADRIQCKSQSTLASQSLMESVILEAVADIFSNYYQTVRQSILRVLGENPNHIEDSDFTSTLAGRRNMTLPSQPYSSTNNFSHGNVAISCSKKDVEDSKIVSGFDCLQHCLWNKVSNYSASVPDVYDNFQSKVSAWMTAVDLVSVLQNLGCLVITGINDSDKIGDMALL